MKKPITIRRFYKILLIVILTDLLMFFTALSFSHVFLTNPAIAVLFAFLIPILLLFTSAVLYSLGYKMEKNERRLHIFLYLSCPITFIYPQFLAIVCVLFAVVITIPHVLVLKKMFYLAKITPAIIEITPEITANP